MRNPDRDWSFLTRHAQVLLCIGNDPGIRLRDIATTLGITERRAFGIVADLSRSGYVIKRRDGRRNRYQLRTDMPVASPIGREATIGELLSVLVDSNPDHTKSRQRTR